MQRFTKRPLAILLSALALTTLVACSGTDPRYEPTKLTVIESSVSPAVKWSQSLSGGAGYGFAPAVSGSSVYAASRGGQVISAELSSGRSNWSKNVGGKLSAGVGVGNGVVVVTTTGAEVIALDENSGEELWRSRAASEVTVPPIVANGVAVVRSSDYRVQGFDARTGESLWSVQRPGPALALKTNVQLEVVDGMVMAGMPNGRILAIDLASGNVVWEETVAVSRGATDLERIIDVVGAPQLQGPLLCAAAYQGRLVCFDLSEGGVPVWNKDFSNSVGPASDHRFLFASDARDVMHAFSLRDGIEIWKQDELKNRRLSPPAVISQALVVGDYEGYLHFLSRADGRQLGRVRVGGGAIESPLLATNQGVVLQGGNGNLLLVDVN